MTLPFYDKYYFNFKYSLEIKYLLPIYNNNIKVILFSYRLTVPSLLIIIKIFKIIAFLVGINILTYVKYICMVLANSKIV